MAALLRLVVNLSILVLLGNAWAAEPPETPTVSEFLVRHQPPQDLAADVSGMQRALDMGARVGESLTHVRTDGRGTHVLSANRKLTRAQAWELAARMVEQGGAQTAKPIDPEFDARPPVQPVFQTRPGARP